MISTIRLLIKYCKVRVANIDMDIHALSDITAHHLKLLKEAELIHENGHHQLVPTAYGLAMDRYYIRYPTMVHIISTREQDTMREMVHLLLLRLRTHLSSFLS